MSERFKPQFEDSGSKSPIDEFTKGMEGARKEKKVLEKNPKQIKLSDSINEHRKPPYPPGKWKSGDTVHVIEKKPTDGGPGSAENAIEPDTVNKVHTDLDVRQSKKAQINFETKLRNE